MKRSRTFNLDIEENGKNDTSNLADRLADKI